MRLSSDDLEKKQSDFFQEIYVKFKKIQENVNVKGASVKRRHKAINNCVEKTAEIIRHALSNGGTGNKQIEPYVMLYFLSSDEKRIDYLYATENYGLANVNIGIKDLDYQIRDWQRYKDNSPTGIRYGIGIVQYFSNNTDSKTVSFDPRTEQKNDNGYNYDDKRLDQSIDIERQISSLISDGNGNMLAILNVELPSRPEEKKTIKDYSQLEITFSLITYFVDNIIQTIIKNSLVREVSKFQSFLNDFSTYDLSDITSELSGTTSHLREIFNIIVKFVDDNAELFILPRVGPHLIYNKELDQFPEENRESYSLIQLQDLRLWKKQTSSEREGAVIRAAEDRTAYYLPYVGHSPETDFYKNIIPTTQSQYTVPMIFENRLLGVLNYGNKLPCAFFRTDRIVISLFTHIASLLLFQGAGLLELRQVIHELGKKYRNIGRINRELDEIKKQISTNGLTDELISSVSDKIHKTHELAKEYLYFTRIQAIPIFSDVKSKLSEAIERVVDSRMSRCNRLKIKLNKGIDDNFFTDIRSVAIEIVASNLLDNAISACASSNNEDKNITISLIRSSKQNTVIREGKAENIQISGFRFTISDNGDEWPMYKSSDGKELVEGDVWEKANVIRIFQPLKKSQTSKGMGLGLWIVDQIVSKWDGFVNVDRVKNETVFSVFIPCERRHLHAMG